MTLEEQEKYLSQRGREIAAGVAFHAAANAVSYLDPNLQGVFWPKLGRDRVFPDEMVRIVDFVRAGGPHLPAEALYRYCGGQAIHDADADGFDDIDRPWRMAFSTFIATLPIQDKIIDGELLRIRHALADAGGEVLASALTEVPVKDTLLRMVHDPLETRPGYVLVETGGSEPATTTMSAGYIILPQEVDEPASSSAPEEEPAPEAVLPVDPAPAVEEPPQDPYPLPPRPKRKA